jgi:hypothetical protein
VRRKSSGATPSRPHFRASGFDHAPEDLGTETARCNPTRLVDRPKSWAGTYTGGGQPPIHCRFDPRWDGYGPHVSALANEVCDYPVLFSLLQMFHRERGLFRSPEPASKKDDSNHSLVTLATKIPVVEDCKESLPLFSSQTIAHPPAMFLHAFHPSDSCGQVRA